MLVIWVGVGVKREHRLGYDIGIKLTDENTWYSPLVC